MNNCRCNPVIEPEIQIKDIICFKDNIQELFPLVNNINELKEKIICEYLGIIDKLECGIQLDLEFILEEISLVDILENG